VKTLRWLGWRRGDGRLPGDMLCPASGARVILHSVLLACLTLYSVYLFFLPSIAMRDVHDAMEYRPFGWHVRERN